MRIARKLTLLAMLAIAATSLTMPSAFAQETEPELHNQTPRLIAAQEIHSATDITCTPVFPAPPTAVSPLVTQDGCRLHVASSAPVTQTIHLAAGGVETVVSNCTIEFDMRVDPVGEGWIAHHEFTGPAGVCTRQPCGQTAPGGEGRAWSYHLSEVEPPTSTEHAVVLFCTEPIGDTAPSHCELTLPLTQPAPHRYRLAAPGTSGHGNFFPHCELTGTFNTEAAGPLSGEGLVYQNVEIRHS